MHGWNSELGCYDLALDIAETLHRGSKNNAKALCCGQLGAGKSYAAMSLAYNIACYNSLFKYKDIDHWQEWFDRDHIAVISENRIRELFKKATKPKNIYIFDDVSVSYSNRSWQTKLNKFLNSLFITSRIYNNCIIMTLPAESMIDLQIRSLFTHYLEITGPLIPIGLNFGKCFLTSLHPRQKNNPVYYYYPRTATTTYDRMAILAPPTEISDWYDAIRKEEVDKLIVDDSASEQKQQKEKENSAKKQKKDLKPLILEYVRENPPPASKTELIEYRRTVAKAIGCTGNYVYKTLRGID